MQETAGKLKDREAGLVADAGRQLAARDAELGSLRCEASEKAEAMSALQGRITGLLADLAEERKKSGRLGDEKEALVAELAAAEDAHQELVTDICELQERYAELMAILAEAQEELKGFRRAPSAQADSLYDSLASELEASDSGFQPSPAVSARPHPPNSSFDPFDLAAQLAAGEEDEAETPVAGALHDSPALASSSLEAVPDDPTYALPPPVCLHLASPSREGAVSPSLPTPSTRPMRTPSPPPERLSPDAASPPKRLTELRAQRLGGLDALFKVSAMTTWTRFI